MRKRQETDSVVRKRLVLISCASLVAVMLDAQRPSRGDDGRRPAMHSAYPTQPMATRYGYRSHYPEYRAGRPHYAVPGLPSYEARRSLPGYTPTYRPLQDFGVPSPRREFIPGINFGVPSPQRSFLPGINYGVRSPYPSYGVDRGWP